MKCFVKMTTNETLSKKFFKGQNLQLLYPIDTLSKDFNIDGEKLKAIDIDKYIEGIKIHYNQGTGQINIQVAFNKTLLKLISQENFIEYFKEKDDNTKIKLLAISQTYKNPETNKNPETKLTLDDADRDKNINENINEMKGEIKDEMINDFKFDDKVSFNDKHYFKCFLLNESPKDGKHTSTIHNSYTEDKETLKIPDVMEYMDEMKKIELGIHGNNDEEWNDNWLTDIDKSKYKIALYYTRNDETAAKQKINNIHIEGFKSFLEQLTYLEIKEILPVTTIDFNNTNMTKKEFIDKSIENSQKFYIEEENENKRKAEEQRRKEEEQRKAEEQRRKEEEKREMEKTNKRNEFIDKYKENSNIRTKIVDYKDKYMKSIGIINEAIKKNEYKNVKDTTKKEFNKERVMSYEEKKEYARQAKTKIFMTTDIEALNENYRPLLEYKNNALTEATKIFDNYGFDDAIENARNEFSTYVDSIILKMRKASKQLPKAFTHHKQYMPAGIVVPIADVKVLPDDEESSSSSTDTSTSWGGAYLIQNGGGSAFETAANGIINTLQSVYTTQIIDTLTGTYKYNDESDALKWFTLKFMPFMSQLNKFNDFYNDFQSVKGTIDNYLDDQSYQQDMKDIKDAFNEKICLHV